MPLGQLFSKAAKIVSKARRSGAGKILGTVGSLTFWFGLDQIASAISRLRVERGQLTLALKNAKKKCKFESDFEKRQLCIRTAMQDFALQMAASYQKELAYYKSILPKSPDEKTKAQIEKAITKTEKRYRYYRKLASLLRDTDMPITVAMDEAKKD